MQDKGMFEVEWVWLESLVSYNILDSVLEQEYDKIVQCVVEFCDCLIFIIILVDCYCQWFKVFVGVEFQEIECDIVFCDYIICGIDVLIVLDIWFDYCFVDNLVVIVFNGVCFYVGMFLLLLENQIFGIFCVMDYCFRDLSWV